MTSPAPLNRDLSAVAADIFADWREIAVSDRLRPNTHPARRYALYLSASKPGQRARELSPMDVFAISEFLAHSRGWRGRRARRVKRELQAALADYATR